MSWVKSNAKDKLFWHITSSNLRESINNIGLKQSNSGQVGAGVYCIEAEDYDALDNLMDFLGINRKSKIEDLIIIEFIYTGIYEFVLKDLLMYTNEGWCVIRTDVPSENILRTLSFKDTEY